MTGRLAAVPLDLGGPPDHVGIVVSDLEAAVAEFTALGLRFGEPEVVPIGEWALRVTFAHRGPPYLELIEAIAGSPWQVKQGAALDHLAWYSDDLEIDKAKLAELAPIEVDGALYGRGFSYHRAPVSGARLELVGTTPEAFAKRWHLERPIV
jgi:catechol 2,3-dioxygenase-like lactoylglutathione lyase family enzyme